MNQRCHKRIAFGGYSAADVLHRSNSVITRHRDRRKHIRKQLGILKGDSGPYHVKPLLLSLLKRANGNGAPKISRDLSVASLQCYVRANDTINRKREAITRPGHK